jgi:hypothetical protein
VRACKRHNYKLFLGVRPGSGIVCRRRYWPPAAFRRSAEVSRDWLAAGLRVTGLVSELGAFTSAPSCTPIPNRSTSSPPSHPVTQASHDQVSDSVTIWWMGMAEKFCARFRLPHKYGFLLDSKCWRSDGSEFRVAGVAEKLCALPPPCFSRCET